MASNYVNKIATAVIAAPLAFGTVSAAQAQTHAPDTVYRIWVTPECNFRSVGKRSGYMGKDGQECGPEQYGGKTVHTRAVGRDTAFISVPSRGLEALASVDQAALRDILSKRPSTTPAWDNSRIFYKDGPAAERIVKALEPYMQSDRNADPANYRGWFADEYKQVLKVRIQPVQGSVAPKPAQR